jgi:hypothetical protein
MATGIVSWINPPENKGKITRSDDGSNEEYEYAVNAGSTLGGFIPKMGDIVIFLPGSGKSATGIEKQVLVPQILSFSMKESILSWETKGATHASINNGVGDISDKLPNGNQSVIPIREPFILTVSNDIETVTQTVS